MNRITFEQCVVFIKTYYKYRESSLKTLDKLRTIFGRWNLPDIFPILFSTVNHVYSDEFWNKNVSVFQVTYIFYSIIKIQKLWYSDQLNMWIMNDNASKRSQLLIFFPNLHQIFRFCNFQNDVSSGISFWKVFHIYHKHAELPHSGAALENVLSIAFYSLVFSHKRNIVILKHFTLWPLSKNFWVWKWVNNNLANVIVIVNK